MVSTGMNPVPIFAFRTADRLIAFDECPDVEPDAEYVMRLIRSLPNPMPAQGSVQKFKWSGDARKYRNTGEHHSGFPLYEEVL